MSRDVAQNPQSTCRSSPPSIPARHSSSTESLHEHDATRIEYHRKASSLCIRGSRIVRSRRCLFSPSSICLSQQPNPSPGRRDSESPIATALNSSLTACHDGSRRDTAACAIRSGDLPRRCCDDFGHLDLGGVHDTNSLCIGARQSTVISTILAYGEQHASGGLGGLSAAGPAHHL